VILIWHKAINRCAAKRRRAPFGRPEAKTIVEGDVVESGAKVAREMMGYSLRAAGLARDAVHRGLTFPLKVGLEIEADLSTLALQTTDAIEGMPAFLATGE
jgi:enoyl-CoA hydratase